MVPSSSRASRMATIVSVTGSTGSPEREEPRGQPPPRYGWHPEADLLNFGSPSSAREPLERLGREAWGAALDYLFDEAMRRPVGPDPYPALRREYFGDTDAPGPA